MTLTKDRFWKTVVAGVIATYVMTMTGFWQRGVGIPAVDVSAMLAGSMTAAHPDNPYTFVAGNLAHFANGVIMALIWVAFLLERVPGNWVVQGVVYGVLTTLAAVVIVVPLAAGVGIFFSNTPMPGRMLLASSAMHVAYGLALTLGLKVAGLDSRTARTVQPSA